MDEAQTLNNENAKEEDQPHHGQHKKKMFWRQIHQQTKNGKAKAKPIVAKLKDITDFTSL